MDIVRALRNLDGVNTALHLCGKYARMAAGETHAPHSLNLLCNGFGRVQVNLHGEATNLFATRGLRHPINKSNLYCTA